jgi:hypothetical protein
MFPYDRALLAAAGVSPQSIPEVLEALEAIEAVCTDGDGLKWFNWLYLEVTRAVAARVASGGFADTAWLAELDVRFASLYFGALASWLSGQPAPGCWRALLERRSQAAIARSQFALAGMNAHINHDLPQAIAATCQATATSPEDRGAQYRDYTSVNATLDTLIESAKQTLRIRLLGDALPTVAHLDETIAAWSLSAAREAAWRNAELLWSLRAAPLLASGFLDTLDGLTTVAGKALLVPVP